MKFNNKSSSSETLLLIDNSGALPSTSYKSISDPANNFEMLNAESEPSVIQSPINVQQSEIQALNSHFDLCEESSCDENDLEIQMQKLDKLLSSKSTDSEKSDLETEMQKFDELLSSKSTDSEKSDLETEIERFYEVLNCESVNENAVSCKENWEACPDEIINKDKMIPNNVSISVDKVLVCDKSDGNEVLNCESVNLNTVSNVENLEVCSDEIMNKDKIIPTDVSISDDKVLVSDKSDGNEVLNSESVNENTVSNVENSEVCPDEIMNKDKIIPNYVSISNDKVLVCDKSDENEVLILCCESDLDDSIYDATVSELESIKSEIISDWEKDITEDASDTVAESYKDGTLIHCGESNLNNVNDDKQMLIFDKVDILNERSIIEEYLEVTDSDADSTLILCCESDLDDVVEQKKMPICETEIIDITDEHIHVDGKCLVPVSINSDLIPHQPMADNSCCVKVQTMISEPLKQNSVKCNLVKSACTVSKSKEFEMASLTDSKVIVKMEKPVKQKMDEVSEPPTVGSSKVNKVVTIKTEPSKAHPAIDFYEREKHDIIDPRWQHVKELSTNEERYQQVKSCWQSTTVPNPDKNLSFHSYRRKQLKKFPSRPIRQHKRQASTKLSGGETKRSRPCTYMFDFKINSINKEKEAESQNLMQEMHAKLDTIEKQHYQKTVSLQNNGNFWNSNSLSYSLLENLEQAHKRKVACIKDEYHQLASENCRKYRNGLESLNQVRNEVLQFYSFYKGLSASTERDPTILSDSQLQELDDIENFYSQMVHYYK